MVAKLVKIIIIIIYSYTAPAPCEHFLQQFRLHTTKDSQSCSTTLSATLFDRGQASHRIVNPSPPQADTRFTQFTNSDRSMLDEVVFYNLERSHTYKTLWPHGETLHLFKDPGVPHPQARRQVWPQRPELHTHHLVGGVGRDRAPSPCEVLGGRDRGESLLSPRPGPDRSALTRHSATLELHITVETGLESWRGQGKGCRILQTGGNARRCS